MKARWAEQLQEQGLPAVKRQVLTSLKRHWAGLLVFVEHPEVPMDNNAAERALRNPVTGRKNYYGSGRVWSAQLAAVMFTVLQTVLLWGLNPRHWLQAFLQACADHGGHPPPDLSEFLPWTMSAERKHKLSQPWSVPLPPLAGIALHRADLAERLLRDGGALRHLVLNAGRHLPEPPVEYEGDQQASPRGLQQQREAHTQHRIANDADQSAALRRRGEDRVQAA